MAAHGHADGVPRTTARNPTRWPTPASPTSRPTSTSPRSPRPPPSRGFASAPPVSQTEALIALGIGEQLDAARARAAADLAAYATARAASETLLDPAGLGRVRVVVMGRGVELDGLTCLRGVGG